MKYLVIILIIIILLFLYQNNTEHFCNEKPHTYPPGRRYGNILVYENSESAGM